MALFFNIAGSTFGIIGAIVLGIFGWSFIKKESDGQFSYAQETQNVTRRQYYALRVGIASLVVGFFLQILALATGEGSCHR